MNLADYLSELLGQHDEVSVPGLGYFVRERVNAYYNDKEGKFYPPHHQVKFVLQPNDDDDTFTQYVADKKNISLASSKYFAEKFITKLREDAATGKYLFADLGLFYTDQGRLTFKPNDKIPDDPAFYGYPMLNTYKLGQPLFPETPKPVFAGNTIAAPAAALVQPVEGAVPERTIPRQPYYEEEAERKRGMSVWLIVLIAVAVVALAAFGVYKFYPSAFDRVKETFNKITHSAAAAAGAKHAAKADSTKKADSLKDTAATVIAPVTTVDTTNESHFEIITGDYSSRSLAETALKIYKDKGLKAKILTLSDAPGNLLKISAGTFHTKDEAASTMLELQNEGKIPSNSYSIEIKPRQ